MDNSKFISILNSSGISKKEIIDAMGLSYTGFDLSVKNNTMKVKALEEFCIVTKTHISEFFPEWTINSELKKIPSKVGNSQIEYKDNYKYSSNEVIQAKNALIKEQTERIKEQSELIRMFQTGKIKVTG